MLQVHDIAVESIKGAEISEPRSDAINLVFASDKKYAKYTAVTLASILKNYTGDKPINVHLLLDAKLPDEISAKIISLRSVHDFDLNEIVVDASRFAHLRTSAGISIATYYRLLMHTLLPASVGKVLYLDSDLIIRQSIDELFNIPFDGHLFAGVQDSVSRSYNKKFGIPAGSPHVNAGVLLVNVDLMRAIGFDEVIRRHVEVNRYRIVLGDQQIIAEIFFGSTKYVPLKWNVHGSMFAGDWIEKFVGIQNDMDANEAREAISDPAIIHYTLTRKPWMSLEHPRSTEWFKYLKLTDFRSDVPVPKKEAPKQKKAKKQLHPLAWVFTKWIPGTAISIARLRQTRLSINALRRDIDGLKTSNLATLPKGERGAGRHDLDIKLKQILTARAASAPPHFNAREAIASLPANSVILSNVHKGDIEGGYNESLKLALRTPYVQYNPGSMPDAVAIVTQRIKQGMFWECLERAYLYDKPLFFVEVALFGAFASYFDNTATLEQKRAFGFMIDDLGYYYDARQPSRLERTLNDPHFALTDEQRSRARSLIDQIVQNRITKYNRYVTLPQDAYPIEDDAIIVIGQKGGDASIHFAGANDESFNRMLREAVDASHGRKVYYKRHPDAILGALDIQSADPDGYTLLPDNVTLDSLIDRCGTVYTVSSQVGFEALLRGKQVVTFGMPFYSGWGLTDDRCAPPRRNQRRTIEDLFHVACLDLSVYVDSMTGRHIEFEDVIDTVLRMRGEDHERQ